MPLQPSDLIEVRRVRGKGRGVFARVAIPEGAVIERAPVLVLPENDLYLPAGNSQLADYAFVWGDGTVALTLGYGSLYNHSYAPNASCRDLPARVKLFRALRDIRAGEEITINYNGQPDDPGPVGFRVQ